MPATQVKKVKSGKTDKQAADQVNGKNVFDLFREERAKQEAGGKIGFLDRCGQGRWRHRFPGRGGGHMSWKKRQSHKQRHEYR